MRGTTLVAAAALAAVAAAPAAAQQAQQAQPTAPPATAEEAYQEMEQMLGTVPPHFREIPEALVPGAWAQVKALELSEETALSGAQKQLIGIAVAAQIPCDYCVYFHTQAAKQAGASEQEIQEALAMAAHTRYWSTVFNGAQVDPQAWREEVDQILAFVAEGQQAAETPGEPQDPVPTGGQQQ